MADEDESSKTEDPTEHKLSRAREEGDVPVSQEVKNWFMLVACFVVLWGIVPFIAKRLTGFGAKFIDHPDEVVITVDGFQKLCGEVFLEMLILMVVPLAVFFLVSIASGLIQVGFLYAPKRLELKWERLDVVSNLINLFSKQKMVENAKGILKIVAVLGGLWLAFRAKYGTITAISGIDIIAGLVILHEITVMIMFTVVIIMLIFAGADYFFQRYSYMKKHRMSKQDLRDEYKQMEGDPQVKAKIRSLRMERFRQQMMQAVPKADAVITNPTHYAVAIMYDVEGDDGPKLPIVTAKGVDFLALRIKDKAKEHDVPIIEDPPLARALYAAVEINDPIPTEHFEAVAKIISYVYKLKGKKLQ